jgi:hypothetical protein
VTNWRGYPAQTRAAVAALCRGSCYFPGCRTPILVFLGGWPAVNVEIAHIRTAEPGRPRYVSGMSGDVVDSFENLLLLCVPHRKAVDRDEEAHPIDLLETWKTQREASSGGALRALGNMPADRLDALLVTALSSIQDQVAEALDRFEKADPESARLIKHLMADLIDQRRHPEGPDTAGTPAAATPQLKALEDHAAKLFKAVEELRERDDNAAGLIEAASSRLENLVTKLETASKRTNVGWTTGT